ncbi:5'-nucleotidase [Roseomonas mucosa]|uniref:Trifunctional nucleotide phosphoesterase protein YfkN n=1 Tax=Roseomonas mucosa TaxID=207340 RepID=A0A379N078_9PROT|nr:MULTISPECIES: 5'-nucleotidase C-terminal domain-containing protein [Roseomonas]MCG7351497.1 bifunctional metallophosphatase/5'-nucleotidase [Roseomonas mucosa]MCG7357548.1 bifunctional metallophosphatase/5'-nucleotidase [Roseomonas mucosa]MDT8291292.1 5'-nucleotidase C-terminal domain-containing protein [Roseomonas mucosa]MDT8292978.1 5'-nucleotidase C-terminal domain-containing protein [Roseomonas mucosa]MDT8314643.1 5'-nucleotidase C-terminal domain-containing protein [Roseomonas mucosa]
MPQTFSLSRRRLLGASLALPALAMPGIRRAQAEPAGRVSIVHFNDFHSHHDPIVAGGAACREGKTCFGGAARLATAIREARAAATADGYAPLTLDAGDEFTGTLFYTLHRGATEAAVQVANGVQAMTLGNHEFDNGPANLARYLERLPFPVVSANLDLADEPALRDRVIPWTMLEAGGRKVAVIGLTTPETAVTSSAGPTVRFGDPAAAVERVLPQLRAQGAATVLVLSHLGLESDRKLARDVAGIDLIVGGHSHTLLANGLDGAEGPDPVMEQGPAGLVRIVQAGCYSRYLGRLDLDLSPEGRVLSHRGLMRELTMDVAPDPAVAAIVATYARPLEELRRKPVTTMPATLSNESCRTGECALGNLMADAMLAAMPKADAAITNGGGMRTGLVEGTVTMGDILAMLPFNNTLATATLKGSDIKAALENGLSRAPESIGRFPQVAGMRVVWNIQRPPGERVVSLEIGGKPYDPEKAYRIVTNNFMRQGGDGYDSFRDKALEHYDNGAPLEDALIDYLSAGKPLPGIDGRLARGS